MSTPAQRPSPEEQVAAPASEDPHHARRWLILAVILVAQVMILLDTTIVNVALPSAQADLGFSDAAKIGRASCRERV